MFKIVENHGLAILLLAISGWVIAGNLEQPSGPGSTMKILDQTPPTCIIKKDPECRCQPFPLQLLFTTKRFEVLADFNYETFLDEKRRLIWTRNISLKKDALECLDVLFVRGFSLLVQRA